MEPAKTYYVLKGPLTRESDGSVRAAQTTHSTLTDAVLTRAAKPWAIFEAKQTLLTDDDITKRLGRTPQQIREAAAAEKEKEKSSK